MFKFSCSYKDTSHIKWQPPILSDLILTWLYLQKLFPNKVTFRGTRSQDFNIYFLGDIIQSITEENWKTIIWGLKSYVDIHMEILKMYILWLSVPLLRIYPKLSQIVYRTTYWHWWDHMLSWRQVSPFSRILTKIIKEAKIITTILINWWMESATKNISRKNTFPHSLWW